MASPHDQLFSSTPLKLLRPASLEMFSQLLNPRKILLTSDGQLRDYRGLAEHAGLSDAARRKVEASADHTRTLISLWCKDDASVLTLTQALAAIDRHDVSHDAHGLLVQDCELALSTGVSSPGGVSVADADAHNALTAHDLAEIQGGRPLTKYNVMVLYGDDEADVDFAFHLIERMEAAGLKVFVPERDLIAGTIEHSASAEIIEQRCDRLVAIFSPSFLESPDNKFLVDLAQCVKLSRGQANKMIVPVMFKRCSKLPPHIRMLTKLGFDPEHRSTVNFYSRLLCDTLGVDRARLTPELLHYPERYSPAPPSAMTATTSSAATAPSHYSTPAAANRVPQIATSPNNFSSFASAQRLGRAESTDSDSFYNLNTMSTTLSALDNDDTTQLDLLSTTDSQASLLRRMPDVPSLEPAVDGSSSNQRSNRPNRILNALTKPFSGKKKKEKAYLAS